MELKMLLPVTELCVIDRALRCAPAGALRMVGAVRPEPGPAQQRGVCYGQAVAGLFRDVCTCRLRIPGGILHFGLCINRGGISGRTEVSGVFLLLFKTIFLIIPTAWFA